MMFNTNLINFFELNLFDFRLPVVCRNTKIETMFGFFKKDPIAKLEKEYSVLMEKAKDVQRSGDLKAYAKMIEESEELWKKMEALNNK